jgi:hypothetical protein
MWLVECHYCAFYLLLHFHTINISTNNKHADYTASRLRYTPVCKMEEKVAMELCKCGKPPVNRKKNCS